MLTRQTHIWCRSDLQGSREVREAAGFLTEDSIRQLFKEVTEKELRLWALGITASGNERLRNRCYDPALFLCIGNTDLPFVSAE